MSETTSTPTAHETSTTSTTPGGGGDLGGGGGAGAPAAATSYQPPNPTPAASTDDNVVKSLRSEAAKYRTERNELQERLAALESRTRETERKAALSRALYVAAVEEDADIELLEGYVNSRGMLDSLGSEADADFSKKVREVVREAVKAKPSIKKSRAVAVGSSTDAATVKGSKDDPLRAMLFR